MSGFVRDDGRVQMSYLDKTALRVVGTRPIRPDGVDKVTGRANFGADMTMPVMLWGRIKRSPYAHARIVSIVGESPAAAATTTAMTEGHRLVVTAQEGDADDREENRETENNNTVHSQILQKYLQVPVSQNYQFAVRDDRIATTDGSVSQCDPSFMIHYIQRLPEQFPVVNFYGLRRI